MSATDTTPTLRMDAEEFYAFAASGEAPRCELIEGEVHFLSPAGFGHGVLTNRLAYFISGHVYENDLGDVAIAETGFRLDDSGKPTVRAPDIAFVTKARLHLANTPTFAPVPPDLAVETASPDDRPGYRRAKVAWWLSHGVYAVWVLDPKPQTVTVHAPDGSPQVFGRGDTLPGGEVLPGFALPLTELFR